MEKKIWDKSPEKLVDTFYSIMEAFPEAELRKMFGYPCAFFNGNMFAGLHESNMVVRLNVRDREKAIQEKVGNEFAPMAGRMMREYVALSKAILNNKTDLHKMMEKSFDFVKTLPKKVKK